jgi:hypothetical protein
MIVVDVRHFRIEQPQRNKIEVVVVVVVVAVQKRSRDPLMTERLSYEKKK